MAEGIKRGQQGGRRVEGSVKIVRIKTELPLPNPDKVELSLSSGILVS